MHISENLRETAVVSATAVPFPPGQMWISIALHEALIARYQKVQIGCLSAAIIS
jgi:hypothetical protein